MVKIEIAICEIARTETCDDHCIKATMNDSIHCKSSQSMLPLLLLTAAATVLYRARLLRLRRRLRLLVLGSACGLVAQLAARLAAQLAGRDSACSSACGSARGLARLRSACGPACGSGSARLTARARLGLRLSLRLAAPLMACGSALAAQGSSRRSSCRCSRRRSRRSSRCCSPRSLVRLAELGVQRRRGVQRHAKPAPEAPRVHQRHRQAWVVPSHKTQELPSDRTLHRRVDTMTTRMHGPADLELMIQR